ncbi:SPOSA6832_02445 [Sporobolomyces salmonicolor]|uniref:SPOSA6832_02445-mRNA-1:cds n=1 Tax=Sporidiobolus salmonicolor TaxID=5005 RepID=A0A0D6ELA8_SPOSA|nr:SPOSA6832_02445 [Sporobolomyces salmonicolor]
MSAPVESAPAVTTEKPVEAPAAKKEGRFDKTFEEERETKHALVDMSTIELKAEDLYDKDKVDLERVELDDVWTLLQCKEEGLTNAEAERRTAIFGPNRLEHKETSAFLQFLSFMWNPLSWVMEGAALVAIALSNGEGRAPDWEDFGEAEGVVIATGANTFFGRAASLVGADDDSTGHLQTVEVEDQLEKDVEEFALRGLRALAVAYEDVPSGNKEDEGNGFELIGLLAIFDPPRDDTKQTIDDAQALGVKVKMVTGDQLAIAKETGRRLGLGDHMYPAKVLQAGGFPTDGKHLTLDEMILDADGFAGVFPEHKYEIVKRLQGLGHLCAMTGDGANDAPALSRANVGIAVEGATDAARGAADIVLTEPGLSTIVHAIRQARVIFQRMRNYSIYACAVTIRIVVGFAVMAFAFQFDFPPFMVLIIALLNDGTIMTLSLDRVLPSSTPDSWDLGEIFTFAFAYGLYLAAGTIAFFCVIIYTTFFTRKFGVNNITDHNDDQLHMIIYLQVAQISQALIFITRSHSFFFMERPSVALFFAFCLAQLVSSIIAAYGDWGFTNVQGISGGWIGIVWIWNIVWFMPLDFVKFGVRALVRMYNKRRGKGPEAIKAVDGVPVTRTTSRHESLYSNRTSFLRRAQRSVGLGGKKVTISQNELQRFSSRQASQSGAALRA